MEISRGLLSTGLAVSGILGLRILLVDRWLWASAPSHAYGLAAFVVVDAVLALAVIARIAFSPSLASVAAIVQLGAMLSDVSAGQPVGVSSVAFRNYLLMDTSFVVLLAVQVSILFVVLQMAVARLAHQHPQLVPFLHRK